MTITLRDIVDNLLDANDTPAKLVLNIAALTGVGYAEVEGIDAVVQAVNGNAPILSTPTSLALHGAAVVANYYLIRGVGKMVDAINGVRDRRAHERLERDLRRYVPLPGGGISIEKPLIALAMTAAAATGAYGLYHLGGWFLSGGPAPSAPAETVPTGPAAPPLAGESCISYGRDGRSLGCFDLRHGMRYPVDPRSYAHNGTHSTGNAQDIACFKDGVHGHEGNDVYAPISGIVMRVDRTDNHDPRCPAHPTPSTTPPGVTCTDNGGINITIENDELRAYLAHGSGIPADITAGLFVEAGRPVMYCGATGNATRTPPGRDRPEVAPHVHFQTARKGGGSWVGFNPFLGADGAHTKTPPARTPSMRYVRPDVPATTGPLAWNRASRGR